MLLQKIYFWKNDIFDKNFSEADGGTHSRVCPFLTLGSAKNQRIFFLVHSSWRGWGTKQQPQNLFTTKKFTPKYFDI